MSGIGPLIKACIGISLFLLGVGGAGDLLLTLTGS